MMVVHPLLIAGAGLVIALLAVLLWHARRESKRLRGRVEAASRNLERLQLSFSRFAPEELVERIIAGGLPDTGEKKEVTVLFADLVGFTSLSESVEPNVLVRILNGYFERMSRAITDHRGFVSTFIGDGILAHFGALEPNPWQGNDSAHAAIAMRTALADYNRTLADQGLPELKVGVGLHRGVGIAGLVGSEDLKEFAIVGRTVNVAARVQDLTRVHGVDILLTEEVRKTLDPRFALRPLPPAELRGIAKPVAVYSVERFEG